MYVPLLLKVQVLVTLRGARAAARTGPQCSCGIGPEWDGRDIYAGEAEPIVHDEVEQVIALHDGRKGVCKGTGGHEEA